MFAVLPTAPRRWFGPSLVLSTEALTAMLCAYWALAANRAFLSAARDGLAGSGWVLVAMVLMLALLHFLMLAPFLARAWARPLLAVLVLVAAVCSHFVQTLGAALDPDMLRNALRTQWTESRELLTLSLLSHVLVQALPAWWLIGQTQLQASASWWRAVGRRVLWWLGALALFVGLLVAIYQPLSSLMRNHKALRYQIVPAAPLWSAPRSLFNEAKEAQRVREPIGQDAKPGPSWAQAKRPRLVVWVVGETVRAANWGPHQTLDGSARDTAPLTGAVPEMIRFTSMAACGTNTEVSLPCMFAPVGRRDYDESRIRRQHSLLHVVAQAGVRVTWLDNQSGCKGVCTGLEQRLMVEDPANAALCNNGQCLDDSLLTDLPSRLKAMRGDNGVHLLVLHMLGNHGPAYHRRVPKGFAPYQPVCASDDLGRCTRAEITNAYDNALRHTDALLSRLWQALQAEPNIDAVMLFSPDHGESLGERGIYLHGLPYAMAPREQTEVPFLMALTPDFAQARGWSQACLKALPEQVKAPQHDHLFHTVLTLLDVKTALYDPAWDLLRACGVKP